MRSKPLRTEPLIGAHVPLDLARAVQALAAEEDRSVASVLRAALRAYVGQRHPEHGKGDRATATP
jgi:predicted transcriptional regulator